MDREKMPLHQILLHRFKFLLVDLSFCIALFEYIKSGFSSMTALFIRSSQISAYEVHDENNDSNPKKNHKNRTEKSKTSKWLIAIVSIESHHNKKG